MLETLVGGTGILGNVLERMLETLVGGAGILGMMLRISSISLYKLGDVGISSNLIGSLSVTNGHCPPPGRWIMKQWPACANSRFAEGTEKRHLANSKLYNS